MATDGSLASLTEDWVVGEIRKIEVDEVAVFESAEVLAWEGTVQQNAEQIANELLGSNRRAIVRVRFRQDSAEELEAGEQKIIALYDIFVGVKNDRPGASRRGDGTTLGSNRFRDLFYFSLHNKRPGLTAGGRTTDKTRWQGSQGAYNSRNASIQLSVLRVDEVPSA